MADKTDPSRRLRVIGLLPAGSTVLTAGGSTAPAADGFFRLIRVGSGYEAAAELLGAPASALVVDLAMLTNGHRPLLKLAAGLNVPVVAFGTVSSAIDGFALAGVHLVGAEQACEVLRSLVNGEADKPAKTVKTVETMYEPAAGPPAVNTVELPAVSTVKPSVDDEVPCLSGKPLTQEELEALLSD